MEKVYLIRDTKIDPVQTLGLIHIGSTEIESFAKTLELPWKNNQNNISCIPLGTYLCKWTRSNRLSNAAGHDVFTYEVLNVPDRTGIRIHSANYFFELKGCITMGSMLKDLNLDQHLDTVHSGNTVKRFNEKMKYQDFELIIL